MLYAEDISEGQIGSSEYETWLESKKVKTELLKKSSSLLPSGGQLI